MGHNLYGKVCHICVEDCDEHLCSFECGYHQIEKFFHDRGEERYTARCRLYDKMLEYPPRDDHFLRCNECVTIFERFNTQHRQAEFKNFLQTASQVIDRALKDNVSLRDIFSSWCNELWHLLKKDSTFEHFVTERLAEELHEAGRKAFESGTTVAQAQQKDKAFPFVEWDALTEQAKEGKRIQARFILDNLFWGLDHSRNNNEEDLCMSEEQTPLDSGSRPE